MRHSIQGGRFCAILLMLALLVAACGGGAGVDDIDDGVDNAGQSQSNDNGGQTGDGAGTDDAGVSNDSGDPGAFRLAPAGWENTCTVLSVDEVAAATGFTVLEARESGGCHWIIEPVDESVPGAEVSIGWIPTTARQVDMQRESVVLASSDIVIESIEGLGIQAFWQGNTVNDLGEVWVQTDQIGIRVINQFASVGYEGDSRQPMESLAAAIASSLDGVDVVAASGGSGSALIPADRVDLPDGIETVASLIPELAAVPLPDGAVIGFGDVYPDRASQDAYLDMSVGDAARFFLDALPDAGFEITSNGSVQTEDQVLEFSAMSISFLDPDGNSGDIHIREGAFAPTQLGIQIFQSG